MALRDVVIIGGGLSGLVAAVELEKANIDYTIIEVKPRFGGSIQSDTCEGFIMDKGAMAHQIRDREGFESYLAEIGLSGSIVDVDKGILFKQGTQVLIDALTKQINAPRMMRMAVSTLGEMYGANRFSICMENGMLLDARALIVASPARYTERMFHTLNPEISYKLLDYQYDNIVRVSCGYNRADAPTNTNKSPDNYAITSIHTTSQLERVPDVDKVLIQVGVRFDKDTGISTAIVDEVASAMGWTQKSLVEQFSIWADADPMMWRFPAHIERLKDIRALLPDGIVLAGNDYIQTTDAPRLDERITLAQESAHNIIDYLG